MVPALTLESTTEQSSKIERLLFRYKHVPVTLIGTQCQPPVAQRSFVLLPATSGDPRIRHSSSATHQTKEADFRRADRGVGSTITVPLGILCVYSEAGLGVTPFVLAKAAGTESHRTRCASSSRLTRDLKATQARRTTSQLRTRKSMSPMTWYDADLRTGQMRSSGMRSQASASAVGRWQRC